MSALTIDSPRTVESLSTLIGELVRERQDLRSRGADSGVLERNRRRIVDLQRDLSRALIERYHQHSEAA